MVHGYQLTSHVLPPNLDGVIDFVVKFDQEGERDQTRDDNSSVIVIVDCVIIIKPQFSRSNYSLKILNKIIE